MKNVNEAVHAFIKACKRTNTRITVDFWSRFDGRLAIDVYAESANDGYLTGESIRYFFDWFNKCWGGRYSCTAPNVNTGKVIGYTPMYRGWYPLKKEVNLSARLIQLVNRYGYESVSNAIKAANDTTVQAA